MLIGKSEVSEFHRNPRRVWYSKLQDVTINGDYEATFELSEPQPSLPVLLASAFSVVYPCTFRRRSCAPSRSVPGRSNWSSSTAAPRSVWCAIPTTGKRIALSRRDHVPDDRQPRDADAGFRGRRIRYHFSADIAFP